MSVAVEFRDVVKEFGAVRVLHGVSFSLQLGPADPGQCFVLAEIRLRLDQADGPSASQGRKTAAYDNHPFGAHHRGQREAVLLSRFAFLKTMQC